MEDVLDIYKRKYDPKRPIVCMDESTKQHIKETETPLPLCPGHGHRYDYEYERNGVSHLFMYYEPLVGHRQVFVEGSHTKKEWVFTMKSLMEGRYKEAEKVIWVMDNLSTHKPSAFYEFLPAKEARALLRRMEFHFTPKHGSWLNMAEIEFSVLQKECLDRRVPDQGILKNEIAVWEAQRNMS